MKTLLRFAGLLFVSAVASAQVSVSSYGTQDLSVEVLDGWSMEPLSAATTWTRASNGNRYSNNGSASFAGMPRLPQGAQIVSFELEACDSSSAGEAYAGILLFDGSGTGSLGLISTGELGTPGCSRFLYTLAAPETVDNAAYRYQVEAGHNTSNGSTSIGGVRVFYRLQVSPAPGAATFGDVPTGHPFFQFIEALAASGITAGCGGGNFCPDTALTRGQMAVFMGKALGLHFPTAPGPGEGIGSVD